MVVSSENSAAWARLQVVRGAPPQRVLLREGEPNLLTVGSDPAAHIRVEEPSVAPRQFEVLWDGHHLWLEDKLRLGRTFVNGQLLNEWTLVHGDVLVSFGPVRVWVAAWSPEPRPSAPDFAALERASSVPASECETRRTPTMRITLTPELEASLNEAAGSLS